MIPLIQMLVALEMLALPLWAGFVWARPGTTLGGRLARLPAPVVLLAGPLLVAAALADPSAGCCAGAPGAVAGVLRAQAVAVGFLVLLAGMAACLGRLVGPRAGQVLVALVGWAVLGSVVLAGPAVALTSGFLQALLVRAAVHGNPIVAAEYELGLGWLRQDLTYRASVLGESYSYLAGDIAWYKTLLAHAFVGSGLLVFSLPWARRGERPTE